MSVEDRRKAAIKGAGFTLEKAAEALGISRTTLYFQLGKVELEDSFVQNVKTKLGVDLKATPTKSHLIDAVDFGSYNDDDPRVLFGDKEYIDLGNGNFLLYVPLIPHIATMGYLSGFADPQWVDELPKHAITVNRIPKGVYRTVIARGQSMFDGTARSIFENAKVTGRVIKPELYQHNKLHLHKYQLYIIVHKEGITIKEITQHDVENRTITLHSWNPDKTKYPDIVLSLEDVLQLLNVIKIERDI